MSSTAKASDPSVRVRFPKQVLRQIDRAAALNGRSRNSEIVVRLAQSLRPDHGAESPAAAG